MVLSPHVCDGQSHVWCVLRATAHRGALTVNSDTPTLVAHSFRSRALPGVARTVSFEGSVMTPTQSGDSSSSATAGHTAQKGAGPFMLTLCRLASPVPIRLPRSPHLKPFTFFTSRSRRPDGSERRYLHMGYLATLTDAQKW